MKTSPTEQPKDASPRERTLEQQVMDAIRDNLGECIQKALTSTYGNPLGKLVESCVAAKQVEISSLITDAFTEITSGEIRAQIKVAAAHKIAKVLVSKMEGEIEKRVNDLRSDPVTRARIILAVEAAITA